MNSPKISIIIPVYNVEKYLSSCLDSIIYQSYKNFEVICVNDCSTDRSLEILLMYAKKDQRIVVINKDKNEGTMLARKSGVDAAKGEFIIFVDSDDYVKDGLCQFIYDITRTYSADIIQFNVDVDGYSVNDNSIKWMLNSFIPLEKKLSNGDIIKEAYITRRYITSLVGKIFNANLCKNVNNYLPNERCYVGEDIFTYFIFSCLAKSYIGIKTPGYYVYRYGLGVENAECMTLAKFEQYCKMSNWVKYAHQFLQQNGSNNVTETACKKMEQRMFEDCCKIYSQRISTEDMDAAANLIVKYWDNNDITDTVMQDKLGVSMDKFIYQASVPVYVKYAEAYKKNLPEVSVVIPVYNVEGYLRECLDSVINQTLKDIEIVCVNDGSPDNSLSIIEEYADRDSRITVVSRKNGGLSAARNSGMQHAKGKYIYFLDSDDFIAEDALGKLYNISENEKLDILYFGVQNYYETEEMRKTDVTEDNYYRRKQFFDSAVKGDVLFERFLNEDMFICCVPFQFINREFLINSGITFKEGMLHEDELFSPQLILEAEQAMVIEDKLYMRRIREDSIMTTSHTHRNFIGYFIAYTTLVSKSITNSKYSQTAKNALNIYARKLYNTAKRIYNNLSVQEKQKVVLNLPEEFKLLAEPIIDYNKTIESYPYKLGMKITFLPRKIEATLSSVRKNGIKNTVQLIRKYYFK